MLPENWKEYVENERQKYKNLGYVECPAFPNEKVYFNRHGFTHLLRKGKIARSLLEQKRRIRLMNFSVEIISKSENFKEHTIYNDFPPVLNFWTFEGIYNDKIVKVVIRQIGNGRKHFYSIMDKRLSKSTKDHYGLL